MESADTDRDGVLTFEEYLHSYEDLNSKRGGSSGDSSGPGSGDRNV
mgnify:CR=1 FL=1|jgi:hypothetical protein